MYLFVSCGGTISVLASPYTKTHLKTEADESCGAVKLINVNVNKTISLLVAIISPIFIKRPNRKESFFSLFHKWFLSVLCSFVLYISCGIDTATQHRNVEVMASERMLG